jgi:hypothetical protein
MNSPSDLLMMILSPARSSPFSTLFFAFGDLDAFQQFLFLPSRKLKISSARERAIEIHHISSLFLDDEHIIAH